ncbi:MAG: HlyC/CorC family transporter [Firmicutes bacterium]|nr:HlyC/CorC family transporter [Bacillota bacterium]
MLSDTDSLSIQIIGMILLILIHGFVVAMNTAFGTSSKITEKHQTCNRFLMIFTTVVGSWLIFPHWKLAIAFFAGLVILGQYFPHKIALQHAEGIATKCEKIQNGLSVFFSPITAILMFITNILLRIFRQETQVEEEVFSEEEVLSMIQAGKESGVLKEEGTKMINSIFAFDDKLAYEIMTPRTDVFSIDIEDPTEEYIEELMKLRHSRIPVCKGDSDNIIGILHIKDYLIKARETKFENVDIESILRKAYFVPDTKNIDSLFFELQKTKQQIAILIDEYGGFSGIVTVEDIIEQVMGNIDDEYDEEEEIIDKVDDNLYLVDGDVSIDDLDEELGIELQSENSETIGGFIIDILGEIPDENDIGRVVEFEDYKFKIMSIEERRIKRVKVYMPDKQ